MLLYELLKDELWLEELVSGDGDGNDAVKLLALDATVKYIHQGFNMEILGKEGVTKVNYGGRAVSKN